jgi:hypothetical protein
MIIHPNYTFSVSDKRLYTLDKGITVTPRLLQAPSASSYGQTIFTRGTSCLCFVQRPFTRPTQPRVTAPIRQSKAAAGAAPSARNPSTSPPRSH